MNAFTEMSAAEKMPVRKMDFEFPDDIDLLFIEDDPKAYLFVGAWMMLPYLEPFLIRTVRKASEQIDDPNLKDKHPRSHKAALSAASATERRGEAYSPGGEATG